MEIIGDAKLTTKKMIRVPDSVINTLQLNIGDNIVFQKDKNNIVVVKKGKVVVESE